MSLVFDIEPRWISPYVLACSVTLRENAIDPESRSLASTRNEDFVMPPTPTLS